MKRTCNKIKQISKYPEKYLISSSRFSSYWCCFASAKQTCNLIFALWALCLQIEFDIAAAAEHQLEVVRLSKTDRKHFYETEKEEFWLRNTATTVYDKILSCLLCHVSKFCKGCLIKQQILCKNVATENLVIMIPLALLYCMGSCVIAASDTELWLHFRFSCRPIVTRQFIR